MTGRVFQRAKYIAGGLAIGASITGMVWLSKPPQHEDHLRGVVMPFKLLSPLKGDLRCEMREGEAYHRSKNFDPMSCGYCGDGIRQYNAKNGGVPQFDEKGFVWVQPVTERPSETAESCPADFHCPNGKLDRDTVYAGIKGDDGGYNIGEVTRTETCSPESELYCKQDCWEFMRSARSSHRPREEPEEEDDPVRHGSLMTCPSQVAPRNNRDVVSASSLGGGSVLGRLGRLVRENSVPLREALGIGPLAKLTLTISMRVNASGVPTLQGVTASCDGIPCSDSATISKALPITLDGLTMSGPGRECSWTVVMRAP